jgi:TFIIF-interacting CTD phosphatase-like protein
MMKDRRLQLILDLDHTLIHATVDEEAATMYRRSSEDPQNVIHRFLFGADRRPHFLKIRSDFLFLLLLYFPFPPSMASPDVTHFFEDLKHGFKFFMFTAAQDEYATKVSYSS